MELEGEKRLPEGASRRWGEPGDEACRMGGDGMVPAGHHHREGGGVERKTNLTLLSYVCIGGETAKWPNAAEGETVAAFLCLFGMSDPPQRKSYFLLRVCFFLGGGSIRGGKCGRSCTVGYNVLGRGAEPPQFWVLLIWLEPGISHVTWVHYDATMCLACFVCSVLPVLHFLRFDLCVL